MRQRVPLQAEDYAAAAGLAFELRQARRLLAVVDAALARGPAAAEAILGGLVAPLAGERLRACLEFCREWNTHSRHCHAAQATLAAVLRHHPPEARPDTRGRLFCRLGMLARAYGKGI